MTGTAAARLRRLARDLKTLPRQTIEAAADTITDAATATLIRDTGGDRSLSNAPRRLKVDRKISGDRIVEAVLSAGPRKAQQWAWLERGTYNGRRGRKRTWSRAVTPAVEQVRADMRTALRKVVRGD